jgi:hypothetical protein
MDNHRLQIILESIDNKFQIVVEGHSSLVNQMAALEQKLTERADITDFKIDTVAADLKATEARLTEKIDGVAADLKATDERLSKKIDGVAADLKAHRADTEAHGGKGLYVVREG